MTVDKKSLPIIGMECAACVKKIEDILKKTDGIKDASANLATEKITIEYDEKLIDLPRISEILKKAGYELIY